MAGFQIWIGSGLKNHREAGRICPASWCPRLCRLQASGHKPPSVTIAHKGPNTAFHSLGDDRATLPAGGVQKPPQGPTRGFTALGDSLGRGPTVIGRELPGKNLPPDFRFSEPFGCSRPAAEDTSMITPRCLLFVAMRLIDLFPPHILGRVPSTSWRAASRINCFHPASAWTNPPKRGILFQSALCEEGLSCPR